jgi:tetratricopeptide (TPR) repeat protein
MAWGEIGAKLPPPDLRDLVPLAAVALDKPPVALPALALPPPPQTLPELPPPRLVTDPAQRPVAPLPSPRILACNPIGTVLHVASELLECGRARYQRNELEEARAALERAIKESSDRRVLLDARYWLGETLLRLGRTRDVPPLFLLVVQDDPRSELGQYAANDLGWVTLELGDPGRALGYFDGLLKMALPPALAVHGRHGRAVVLYGLKRYAEAREEWARLLSAGGFSTARAPRPLIDEANFWLGETLGRLGDYKGAVPRLEAFTAAGPRLLIDSGLLRLGWWARAAGDPLAAIKAYRTLLGAYPNAGETPWARAGLVQALLDLDDYAAAREEARRLEATSRGAELSLPTWLSIRRWLADKTRVEDARALDDELLARTLDPATRAWVLLVSAERARLAGETDEARNRFDLVRQSPAVPAFGFHAGFRLAQLDFDGREFAQSEAGLKTLLGEALPADLRATALLLAGEAAYWSRNYDAAAMFYTRFLTDVPKQPQSPQVGLALGWAEFRRGRLDAARQRWTAFAAEAPTDPRGADALLLSAELAAKAGDLAAALRLLGEVILKFPNSEQAQVAILNRAVLALNAGRAGDALPELGLLIQRAPLSPYMGRVRLAKGVALLALGRAAEAQPDFQAALGAGEEALAHLGLGVVAFERVEWEAAAREFAEARAAGSGPVAAIADYGLAAAAFNQRKTDEFKQLATSLLARPGDPRVTPNLLYGMDAVAADEKRWPEARELALRLSNEYPRQAVASAALAQVAAAAGADGQWRLAREMYETLATRHRVQAGSLVDRLVFAESLLRTGSPAEARRELETFIKASASDPRMPRALILLAEAQEASGNRGAALELYRRVDRDYPAGVKDDGSVLLGAARLLQADGRWAEARGFLDRALARSDPRIVGEAAYRLGEGLRAAGQNEDAVEAYMTAAYLAPDSSWARRALLGAGQSFAALKQGDSAVIVYKKLLAAPDLEPELATVARTRLKDLGAK